MWIIICATILIFSSPQFICAVSIEMKARKKEDWCLLTAPRVHIKKLASLEKKRLVNWSMNGQRSESGMPGLCHMRVAPRDNANEPMFDSDSMLEQKSYGLHFENNPDTIKNKEQVDNSYEVEKKISDNAKQSCAIVVLSNIQNPNMHSLLRKYRYDSNGVLIPSSVKYFVKLPKGAQSSTVLVPLHDKAFSPLGGFVRYYKEVPPIPQSW